MWTKAVSFLGSPIFLTDEARAQAALRFFRVSTNLGIGRRSTLVKFARYIKFGFLSPQDAQDLLNGRLEKGKLYRYSLAKYWIKAGFVPESWFYFSSFSLWLDTRKVENPSTTLFPSVEPVSN